MKNLSITIDNKKSTAQDSNCIQYFCGWLYLSVANSGPEIFPPNYNAMHYLICSGSRQWTDYFPFFLTLFTGSSSLGQLYSGLGLHQQSGSLLHIFYQPRWDSIVGNTSSCTSMIPPKSTWQLVFLWDPKTFFEIENCIGQKVVVAHLRASQWLVVKIYWISLFQCPGEGWWKICFSGRHFMFHWLKWMRSWRILPCHGCVVRLTVCDFGEPGNANRYPQLRTDTHSCDRVKHPQYDKQVWKFSTVPL